ncbi:hypothetical protein RDWZM_004657 [Blomia tropicalis]|uniref:Protein kinase domain-containing protein n=1 Tax=Blomia tropicalis TaxID=40697 RepID=A0A9Q0RLU7_BLOTA|nr:hypothetical protein RDWZM_004657 [Blomia tropicalis]
MSYQSCFKTAKLLRYETKDNCPMKSIKIEPFINQSVDEHKEKINVNGEDGETDSRIHSENHELTLSQEWPITNLTNTTRRLRYDLNGNLNQNLNQQSIDQLMVKKKTKTKTNQQNDEPSSTIVSNNHNGFRFAISEYVSVNREPTSLSTMPSKAIKYLHRKRLDERGFRMTSKKLGEGGFGAVYKVYPRNGTEPLACKIMTLSRETKSKKDKSSMLATFSNEVFVMQSSKHSNIISIREFFIYSHGTSTDDIRMVHSYIVMEYASMGTLYGRLKRDGPFSEWTARYFLEQISQAVAHLHRRGIAHRDLKLGNILLTGTVQNEQIKLTDFGLSRLVNSAQSGFTKFTKPAGTLSYMSPELIACYVRYNTGRKDRIRPYDCFTADMWALGVCLYLMLCKVHPFDSPPSEKAERVEFAKKMWMKQRSKDWKLPSNIQQTITDSALHLMSNLMEPKCLQRYTIYETLEHNWFINQKVIMMNVPKEKDLPQTPLQSTNKLT